MTDSVLNVATPPDAVVDAVPESVALPGVVSATATVAVDVVRLPKVSSIRTVTDGEIDCPATALVGCAANFSALAAAGVMLTVCETFGSPVEVAVMSGVPASVSR